MTVAFRGTVKFTVPLACRPADRPRARAVRGTAFVYMPQAYQVWQKEAAKALQGITLPSEWVPAVGPVGVNLTVHLPKPKSTVRVAPPGDVDNHAKSVLDALTKDGRFWKDDTQVVTLSVTKRWAEGEPRIDIAIAKTGA